MIFEIEKKKEPAVLKVDTVLIDVAKRDINREISVINSFIDEFNEAHLGMPIKFNESYTKALLTDRLPEVAGTAFGKYLSESPKFLQDQLRQTYREYIEAIYNKSSHISKSWSKMAWRVADSLNIPGLIQYINISDDGKLSMTSELEELITERHTTKSDDIDPVLAEKFEAFINLENELKQMVGEGIFKSILTSQCPNEVRYDGNHMYNFEKLVSYMKRNKLNTYKTKEQD